MNTIGIVLLVLGLIGMSIGVYGYSKNKDDASKKKVYTWIGGSASLLLVIAVAMMFMGGDSKPTPASGSTSAFGELSNDNLSAMKKSHNNKGTLIDREVNLRRNQLEARLAKLTG